MELRLLIYGYIVDFGDDNTVTTDAFARSASIDEASLKLMRVCATMRDDVMTLFHQQHRFIFISLPAISNLTRDIGTYRKAIREVHITAQLGQQKQFIAQLPEILATLPGLRIFSLPVTETVITKEELSTPPLNPQPPPTWTAHLSPICRAYHSTWFEVLLRRVALDMLRASPMLASWKLVYHRPKFELRFMADKDDIPGALGTVFRRIEEDLHVMPVPEDILRDIDGVDANKSETQKHEVYAERP